jgi:retron-type reverse transcriptase
MLLEPIYEEQFFDFSYGFRPGRSAHQTLQRIWKQIMDEPIQWIAEVDIGSSSIRSITTDFGKCFASGSQTE